MENSPFHHVPCTPRFPSGSGTIMLLTSQSIGATEPYSTPSTLPRREILEQSVPKTPLHQQGVFSHGQVGSAFSWTPIVTSSWTPAALVPNCLSAPRQILDESNFEKSSALLKNLYYASPFPDRTSDLIKSISLKHLHNPNHKLPNEDLQVVPDYHWFDESCTQDHITSSGKESISRKVTENKSNPKKSLHKNAVCRKQNVQPVKQQSSSDISSSILDQDLDEIWG